MLRQPKNGSREFQYGGCKGNRNRFLSEDKCSETCQTKPVEKKIEEEESVEKASSSSSSAATYAEAILGVILCILAIVAVGLAVKYYRMRKDRDNYRIFNNEQHRQRRGSVSTSSISGVIQNAVDMSYENPSYAAGQSGTDQGEIGGGDGRRNQFQLNGISRSQEQSATEEAVY